MSISYKNQIKNLISKMPFDIDLGIQLSGRPPTMASSEFLTNKEQGDWAEELVFNAINSYSKDYCAVKYGRSDSLAAGDPGFKDFYTSYQSELNTIGKKPDLLIFNRAQIKGQKTDTNNIDFVSKAISAIEIRSSSFLANRYSDFMNKRTDEAIKQCHKIRKELLEPPAAELLKKKNAEIFNMIKSASGNTFKEIDFRFQSWSSSRELESLSSLLKNLKTQIKILHKRDYLSITPKLEDIALVNRWINKFNVRHYYLQVFFDKAYIIPFKSVLEITTDSEKEGVVFSIEKDVKNQRKTTIKINIQVGQEIIGKIDMPKHKSTMKELERGRLLFYVTFHGGHGYLDNDIFLKKVINDS